MRTEFVLDSDNNRVYVNISNQYYAPLLVYHLFPIYWKAWPNCI